MTPLCCFLGQMWNLQEGPVNWRGGGGRGMSMRGEFYGHLGFAKSCGNFVEFSGILRNFAEFCGILQSVANLRSLFCRDKKIAVNLRS